MKPYELYKQTYDSTENNNHSQKSDIPKTTVHNQEGTCEFTTQE